MDAESREASRRRAVVDTKLPRVVVTTGLWKDVAGAVEALDNGYITIGVLWPRKLSGLRVDIEPDKTRILAEGEIEGWLRAQALPVIFAPIRRRFTRGGRN